MKRIAAVIAMVVWVGGCATATRVPVLVKPLVDPGGAGDFKFVAMGDNRPNSRDSRFWGYVPMRSVIGKVFLVWWPPSHFGLPKS